MKPQIVLSPKEIYLGATAAMMRQVQNIADMRKNELEGNTRNLPTGKHCRDWQVHIEGMLAEQAFAKHANLYWSVGERGSVDFMPNWEIKMSQDHDSPLWVQKSDDTDPLDRQFVLITGYNGTYTIQGGILGRDAKQDQWYRQCAPGRNKAFGVPQKELRDV